MRHASCSEKCSPPSWYKFTCSEGYCCRAEEAENIYANFKREKSYGGVDLAPDGRPLFIGTQTYEEWVKHDEGKK